MSTTSNISSERVDITDEYIDRVGSAYAYAIHRITVSIDHILVEHKGMFLTLSRVDYGPEGQSFVPVLTGERGTAKGTGSATRMYLEGMQAVQRQGGGIFSHNRNANSEAMWRRLGKMGVPFSKGSNGEIMVTADDLQTVDFRAMRAEFDLQSRVAEADAGMESLLGMEF